VTVRRAALFDMDRTLVRVDTATLYVRYQRDVGEATWQDAARVAWWMFQYTLGVIDAARVAEQALQSFKGKREAWLRETCMVWFADSTPYAALPLARELGIPHVVATHLEVEDGCFTGRVMTPMGYGQGKVVLAERLAAEQGFSLDDATFYSDSFTDLPLLERVRTPVVVNPDRRLRRIAERRRWRVESW
jgi:phosphoserine phosphatase